MADEKILKEEEMSQDELDGVAGGSNAQNSDLLHMMLEIDPGPAKKFMAEYQEAVASGSSSNSKLCYGVTRLLQNYINGAGLSNKVHFDLNTSDTLDNLYTINGKQVSHKQFMQYLNPAF